MAVSLDSLEDPLDAILTAMQAVETTATRTTSAVRTLKEGLETLAKTISPALSPIGIVHSTINTMSLLATSFTHDVELCLSKEKLNYEIQKHPLSQIDIVDEDFEMHARPSEVARVFLQPTPLVDLRARAIAIETRWDVSISGQSPFSVILVQQAIFQCPRNKDDEIRLHTSLAPRFFRPSGTPFDPFGMVPLRDGLRLEMRRQLLASLDDALQKIQINISDGVSGALPPSAFPHFYNINGDLQLGFQILKARRTKFPLAPQLTQPHDTLVRIRKDLITPRISSAVNSYGAQLQKANYLPGRIELQIYMHIHEEPFWPLEVDVDVYLRYAARIGVAFPAEFFVDLSWIEWWANITVKNCWPACDTAMRRAKRMLRERIKEFYYLTAPFEDFSSIAHFGRGAVDPYGVRIYLGTV